MRVNLSIDTFSAPKGQQILAQGFNPGLSVPSACALKVALDGVAFANVCGLLIYASYQIWCPFRAHRLKPSNPGLKPWAKFLCPFGDNGPPTLLKPLKFTRMRKLPEFGVRTCYLISGL